MVAAQKHVQVVLLEVIDAGVQADRRTVRSLRVHPAQVLDDVQYALAAAVQ